VKIVVSVENRSDEIVVNVTDGVTVEEALEAIAPDTPFAELVVRVNRQLATANRVLRAGDRVHIASIPGNGESEE
jgi:hypothetical protein